MLSCINITPPSLCSLSTSALLQPTETPAPPDGHRAAGPSLYSSLPTPQHSTMKVTNPLQRGKACLSCRKRKMKCDGTRPVCSQCTKANREAECQYHDKKQVSRTEMLRAKMAKLEERLRQLENEQSVASSSSTSDTQSPEPSSSSLMADGIFLMPPGMVPPNSSASPESDQQSPFVGLAAPYSADQLWSSAWSDNFSELSIALHDPQSSNSFLPISSPRSPPTSGSPAFSHEDDLYSHSHQLLDIFLKHRHQCAFDLHIGRFRASLSAPSAQQQPHQALLDAMCLMGCYFSHLVQHAAQEPQYLQNALSGISTALQHNDRLVQIVQASCLIAVYFFSRGRVLEGYYHSSTAARLAVSLGLHQIKPEDWYQHHLDASAASQLSFISFKPSLQLTPSRDALESAERVATFWQVFVVDRAWSVASGLPAALPDDDSPRARIQTSLPTSINDSSYGASIDSLTGSDVEKLIPSWNATSVALFERTYRFSSKSFQTDGVFREEHRRLDLSLSQFANSLPPLSSLMFRDHYSPADIALLTVHTLMNTAIIHLHRDFLQRDQSSYQRCVSAAHSITKAVRELNDAEYEYLNPIFSTCWRCAAHVYLQTLTMQRSQIMPNGALIDGIQAELSTLLHAMRTLGNVFSVACTCLLQRWHTHSRF
ncbi:hypothetical protein BDY19DRAFT_919028 [Irpex rosettiformis]|uniref:Uncharacterized protein n=1 Tax=Irpex rosettiformis TaxID=378272 RepID=A0ACB8UHH6_9APHY|nr:hypothetical protein BDY19DRAFT_919028 [Irpex rosettiformis]